jgi:signal transduction histidine kinase/CheY-like chemotaxis protein
LFAAFVCVNRKLCALHDAFSVREGGLGSEPTPPEGTSLFFDDADTARPRELSPDAPFGSQLDLQREHGVTSENAHGAFYVFLVATVFNLNAALWSVQKGRSRLNLQVAYISAVAAYTHFEMWLGRDWYVTVRGVGSSVEVDEVFSDVEKIGVSFSALRVLEWVFTTPVLLLLVQHLHEYAFAELPTKADFRQRPSHENANAEKSSDESRDDGKAGDPRVSKRSISAYAYKPVNKFLLIAADEAMIACGVLMPVFPYGAERFALLCTSMLCFLFVIKHSVFAIVDIMLHAEIDFADGCRLFAIAALKVIAWSGYPLVYFLTEYGFLTVKQQHEFYLYNDVLTKFSYSLMISAGSLRCLDLVEEHKQKIATQMSQAQRAFFFNVTHELRTPLNSIIGFNTLAMESGELTDFTGAFIKASLTSAEALLGLINQILDFAKFEGAKDANGRYNGASAIELSEDVWTVRQLMEQVTDMTQKATSALDAEPGDRDAENGANLDADFSASSASARRAVQTETSDTSVRTAANAKKARSEKRPDIVVTLATPEHFNTAFVGDFFRLRQCCVNLVDNAVKYSTGVVGRDALVELVVTVTDVARDAETSELSSSSFSSANTNRGGNAWSDDEDSADFADFAQALTPKSSRVTFEVRDNGVGIPAAKQHALFVPFCQPAEHRAAKEKGTGLGLVITKSIVECMGGEIDFVSVEDVGTRFFFTVEFPRAGVGGGAGAAIAKARSPTPRESGEKNAETETALRRGSVDAVLDAGSAGGLGSSDGSITPSASPSASDGEETTHVSNARAREKKGSAPLTTEKDDVLPPAAKIVVHPSMRAATRRHAVNILKCFRASPGSNYVVCKSLEDVDQKFKQAKRLGAPVVFVEASEDAKESVKMVEATLADETSARESANAKAVSFEDRDSPSHGGFEKPPERKEKRSLERGVVVFGRPRQLMELRKRLGDREDVACVFEPAKPSEVLRATRRLTETLLASRSPGLGGSDSEALKEASRASAVDLAGYGFDVAGSKMRNVSDQPGTRDGVVEAGFVRGARGAGSPRESRGESPTSSTSLDGMCVLLVEDNLMNQQMAKHSIVKCGVALDIAGDGAEAVSLVERKIKAQKKYDAILMDMMMPVKDGATATREIRLLERDVKIPLRHVIIGLSANVGPTFVTEVRAAGMDGVVSKPFYPKTLRRALLEVRKGEYQGFAEHEPGGGEVPGSSPAGDDEPGGGFVEDRGEDEKRIRRVSSSDAAA